MTKDWQLSTKQTNYTYRLVVSKLCYQSSELASCFFLLPSDHYLPCISMYFFFFLYSGQNFHIFAYMVLPPTACPHPQLSLWWQQGYTVVDKQPGKATLFCCPERDTSSASTLGCQPGAQFPGTQLKKLGSVLPNTGELIPSCHTASQEMNQAVSKGNWQDSRWTWPRDTVCRDKHNQKWQQLAFI